MNEKHKISTDYYIILAICAVLIIAAFVFQDARDIFYGYALIAFSRSVLVTDYVALAGLGAALVNAAASTLFFLILLICCKRKPDGKVIAALFLTIGFSLFGKNIFNSLPICLGVLIYAKSRKESFGEYLPLAMFGAAIAPIVSEIVFYDENYSAWRFIAAYAVGIFIGFIFPVICDVSRRIHNGYCLYNSGIAAGLISLFVAGLMKSVGLEILPESLWDTSHTAELVALTLIISVGLIVFGLVADKPRNAFKKLHKLVKLGDIRDEDFLAICRNSCYINIGIMCIISMCVMLLLGTPINGPILGATFTVAGFAAAGKNLKNTIPIMVGSVIAAHFNHLEATAPSNVLAILFSTCLAPIASKYGAVSGIIAGFMHVSLAIFIGSVYDGLNLYSNGFAGGFVAITLVPLIVCFKGMLSKRKRGEGDSE
ncbi:MAG: DUF1576 domain-containing protein [Oscillospiraceae bacterium]|nr:DUF1576 domain-containing protein [Oscillospiraceae bacterium]